MQITSTVYNAHIHSFIGRGAWDDCEVRLILEQLGYSLFNAHLQYHVRKPNLLLHTLVALDLLGKEEE